MGKWIRWSGLALAVLLTLPALPARAQDGLPVREIEFRGNTTHEESSLREMIRTEVGKRFTDEKLQEDISSLRVFFGQVTAVTEPVAGGLKVIFTVVEENPLITSVVFRGFAGLKLEDARAEVQTRRGWPFAEYKVEQDVRRLEELLRQKGYYFAEVRPSVGDYAGGKQILFTAIEGPEVEIEEIRFVGNDSFDADRLLERDVMFSEESGWLTSAPYVERTLEQDLVSIRNFYWREGYLDSVVDLRGVEFSEDKEEAYVTIGVTEGEPYVIRSVRIEGGESFPADRSELTDLLDVEEGQVRRMEDLWRTQKVIRNFYLENAYYDVDVRILSDDVSADHTSAITFEVHEGKTSRIRRVDIRGNAITREDVVRRYLTVHPGGPLNSLEIEKSISRLENTQFFELPGGVGAEVVDTDEEGVKDVVIHLKEGRTGSIRFSAGVTSDFGLLGLVEVDKKNFDIADTPDRFGDVFAGRAFTGGGQSLNLSLSPGTSLSRYRLAFTEPWFLEEYVLYGPSDEVEETPFSLGFDIYHTDFSQFEYDQTRTGAMVSTGKSWRSPGKAIDDVFRARVSFRLENVTLENLDEFAPPNAFPLEGVNRAQRVTFGLGWDHVDLPASPGRGFESDLTYQLAGGPIGGEIDFHSIQGSITQYFTLYTTREEQRHILSLSGQTGWASSISGAEDVPLFDRFLLGGSQTIRGFAYGEVGPRAEGNPLTPEGRALIEESRKEGRGDPLGGESMWLFKAEYSFPLYADILRGVTFVDAGNVSEGHYDRYLFNRWRASAGFGLRIRLPFFGPVPIALDFGWPIRREKGDDLQVVSFSIDRPF